MDKVDTFTKEITEKKKFLLEDINSLFSKIFKRKRKIKYLNDRYDKELKELFDISKEIKAEAVAKTRFNSKVMQLMKDSQQMNARMRFKLSQSKKQFSSILKNMGKNMMKELFLVDKVDALSKGEFRRYIETKVKNFLAGEYIDFENISHVHLFEKMKKAITNDPIFSMSKSEGIGLASGSNYENDIEIENFPEENNYYDDYKSLNMLLNGDSTGNNLTSSINDISSFKHEYDKSKMSLITDYIIGNNLSRINTRKKRKVRTSITAHPAGNTHSDSNTFHNHDAQETYEVFHPQNNIENLYPTSNSPSEFNQKEENSTTKIMKLINEYFKYLDLFNLGGAVSNEVLESLALEIEAELKDKALKKDKTNLFQIIEEKLANFLKCSKENIDVNMNTNINPTELDNQLIYK